MYVYSDLDQSMKEISRYLIWVMILFFFGMMSAQNTSDKKKLPLWEIRGSIRESDTYDPISKANIEVNGGAYTRSNQDGSFTIRARKGDELIIRHKDFETIYYTIISAERITVKVKSAEDELIEKDQDYEREVQSYESLIDSILFYKKRNVEKSIDFVGRALSKSNSQAKNAEVYQLLADVYMYWEQYDLAITNYRLSIQNTETNEAQLGLGKAYRLNKNYQESIDTYGLINKSKLTNYQLVMYYEGLGDTYFSTKNYNDAITVYKQGLKVAKQHLISPKEVDLNSKIAQAYNESGSVKAAEGFFSNSMSLAAQQTKKRELEEKVTVADFQSRNRNYSEEIELRKQIIEDVDEVERDSVILNESAITKQKQNYKIGSAYANQNDFDNAIPYLEKSIREADDREDLVVKKDATRKLSDVYANTGNFEKAKAAFEDYKLVVDELYIKREQELSQADRFRRNIAEQQNRIMSLESDRKLNRSLASERSKNQQLIIYSLAIAIILLSISAFFMYKYIKQQRLANNLLALKSLRSQMNPHFIFNALNSVNSFIAINDERTANKYLTDFSQLMRAVLENSEEDFIPLTKEIELLELYTKLEHFRFKDKFNYEIIIDKDIKIEDYQIPPMLLQPYVENAVWHGLRYKKQQGQLKIAIDKKSENEITISIIDDGIGRERSKTLKTENQQKQNSKGMGNIKKRVAILNNMYKGTVEVTVKDFQNLEDSGTEVVVSLRKN